MPAIILTETSSLVVPEGGGSFDLTQTVDDLGGQYQWDYRVTNSSVTASPNPYPYGGLSSFRLTASAGSILDGSYEGPAGWSVSLSPASDGSLVNWQRFAMPQPTLALGESMNFKFKTLPVGLVEKMIWYSDAGLFKTGQGPGKVPGEKPEVRLRVDGVLDQLRNAQVVPAFYKENEIDVFIGKKVHINDNFDEGAENLAGTEWVSDNLVNPKTGKHQINLDDPDLVYATLQLKTKQTKWSLTLTSDPSVKVWYQEWRGEGAGTTWKEVPATGFTGDNETPPERIYLYLEGVSLGVGSVKAELKINDGKLAVSDETKTTVFTGIVVEGKKDDALVQLAKSQIADANAWTLDSDDKGATWRTGAKKVIESWQFDVRLAFNEVFAGIKETRFVPIARSVVVFDSISGSIDPGDFAVLFAKDKRVGSAILVHSWYEQYYRRQNDLPGTAAGWAKAHPEALKKEALVLGTKRKAEQNPIQYDDYSTYVWEYENGLEIQFDVGKKLADTAIKNLFVTWPK